MLSLKNKKIKIKIEGGRGESSTQKFIRKPN
jgi:hypothetical protein